MSSSKHTLLSLHLKNGYWYFSLLFMIIFSFQITSCMSSSETADRNSKEDKIKSKELIKRENIIEFARSFQGTPYKYAGKNPKGFDCSGFSYFVMKEYGIQIGASSQLQYLNGQEIPMKDLKPGDLIFFGRNLKKITHVGIITKNSKEGLFMIHSSSSRGIIEENIDKSPYWQERILTGRTLLN